MEEVVVFSLFYPQERLNNFVKKYDFEKGDLDLHFFPDKECCLKINTDIENKNVVLLDSLDDPNLKILTILFFAETAKSLKAKSVTLFAPYLSYMRQDKVFNKGEGISAEYFAKIISNSFTNMVTIDPHLHRYNNLNQIYTAKSTALTASKNISDWIAENIKKPILVGPDQESKQWVKVIAEKIDAPFLVLTKKRFSDKHVEISIPELENYLDYTPVVVDDIISSGHTMLESIKHILKITKIRPYCIAVHALFADNSFEKLTEVLGDNLVTCNTVLHVTNKIDLSNIMANYIKKL